MTCQGCSSDAVVSRMAAYSIYSNPFSQFTSHFSGGTNNVLYADSENKNDYRNVCFARYTSITAPLFVELECDTRDDSNCMRPAPKVDFQNLMCETIWSEMGIKHLALQVGACDALCYNYSTNLFFEHTEMMLKMAVDQALIKSLPSCFSSSMYKNVRFSKGRGCAEVQPFDFFTNLPIINANATGVTVQTLKQILGLLLQDQTSNVNVHDMVLLVDNIDFETYLTSLTASGGNVCCGVFGIQDAQYGRTPAGYRTVTDPSTAITLVELKDSFFRYSTSQNNGFILPLLNKLETKFICTAIDSSLNTGGHAQSKVIKSTLMPGIEYTIAKADSVIDSLLSSQWLMLMKYGLLTSGMNGRGWVIGKSNTSPPVASAGPSAITNPNVVVGDVKTK